MSVVKTIKLFRNTSWNVDVKHGQNKENESLVLYVIVN